MVGGKLVQRFPQLEEKAATFGRVEYLLSSSAGPFNTDDIVSELIPKLANFTGEDYLLLVGNPVLIGLCTAIAAQANEGCVNLLQWSGRNQEYFAIYACINPEYLPALQPKG